MYNKRKKHTNTFDTLQSCRWNLDFNEPEGRNGGNTRCINAPVSPDQTSENLRRAQQEGGLQQSFKKWAKQSLTAAILITASQPSTLAQKGAAS